jgi:hypothetical protein
LVSNIKNNTGIKSIDDAENYYNLLKQVKVFKAYLIFFATLRIISFLNFSFFINFYSRVFYKFYNKYFNLYLFPCWSILLISIYYYSDLNWCHFDSLMQSLLYVRKSLYDNINQKEYIGIKTYFIGVNFAVLIFLKIFVFSLIFAGIKSVYYDEVENYQKCQKKFKGKLLGDFIFFWILSPFHFVYYFIKGRNDFNKTETKIMKTIHEGLSKYGRGNKKNLMIDKKKDEKSQLEEFKEKIEKNQLEEFYSFFQMEGNDKILSNNEYLSNLKKNYFIEKIQLEKRDVYIIGDNHVRKEEN